LAPVPEYLKNKNSFSQRNFYKTREIARKSVEEHLSNLNIKANVVFNIPDHLNINYNISNDNLISIIIPTRDMPKLLNKCISSILQKTKDLKFEIIIINNNSKEIETLNLFTELSKNPIIGVLAI
jgi:predicted PilT family ATPase